MTDHPQTEAEAELAEQIRGALLIEDALTEPAPGAHRVVASPRLRVRIVSGLIRKGYRPPPPPAAGEVRSLPPWCIAPEHQRVQAEDIAEYLRQEGDHEGAARVLAGIDDEIAENDRKFQEYLDGKRGALDA